MARGNGIIRCDFDLSLKLTSLNMEPESKMRSESYGKNRMQIPELPSTESASTSAKPKEDSQSVSSVFREVCESIAIAFILAFLFRTFIGEAFVIPTGSMAPTLMGRHRDLICPECGFNFQVGTSNEVDASGAVNPGVSLSSAICPNCRYTMDLSTPEARKENPSYGGDRILVSKFAYWFYEPQRWDVSVFFFPGKARENYIKRMVGLPNETVKISQGDIFTKPKDATEYTIQRKPPEKILATMRPVFDNDCQSEKLRMAGVPSSWMERDQLVSNVTSEPNSSWEVSEDGRTFRAVARKSNESSETVTSPWLTYQHLPLSYDQWESVLIGEQATVPAQLITDFLSYNMISPTRELSRIPATSTTAASSQNDSNSGSSSVSSSEAWSGAPLKQTFAENLSPRALQGNPLQQMEPHWVGDLILESELEITPTASGLNPDGDVIFSLIKGGCSFSATLNLGSGIVTLGTDGVVTSDAASHSAESIPPKFAPKAQTPILYPGTYRIRFANVDDRMTFWVNDQVQEFSESPEYQRPSERWRPVQTDLTPVRIGFRRGASATDGGVAVSGLKLYRDLYYIATRTTTSNPELGNELLYRGSEDTVISHLLSTPSRWDVFQNTPEVEMELGEDQFLFFGDNSACSLDGRQWVSSAFGNPASWGWDQPQYWVDRSLLKGKAVFLFWPHSWHYISSGNGEPTIPLWPNTERMKRIR